VSRVVLDTNVLVSFVLNTGSVPGRAVERVLHRHEWIGTPDTIAEFFSVIFSAKLDRFVAFERREEITAFLSPFVSIRRVNERIEACRDPKDNKFLEAALAGDAHFLVTGDGDLLALDPFQRTTILNPASFLMRMDAL
jgi:putative PIN family toxin of toxin-antitoxin system